MIRKYKKRVKSSWFQLGKNRLHTGKGLRTQIENDFYKNYLTLSLLVTSEYTLKYSNKNSRFVFSFDKVRQKFKNVCKYFRKIIMKLVNVKR